MSGHNAKNMALFQLPLASVIWQKKFTQMITMWSCTTRNSQTKKQLDHDEKGISWTDVIFTSHNLAKYLLTPRDPGSGSRPAWSQRQPGMPFHLWTRASWPALQCLPHPGKENVLSFIEREKLGKSPLAICTIVHLMWLAVKVAQRRARGGGRLPWCVSSDIVLPLPSLSRFYLWSSEEWGRIIARRSTSALPWALTPLSGSSGSSLDL